MTARPRLITAWVALAGLAGLIVPRAGSAGGELAEFYRSTRAAAMGGAYLGLSDDESAIFLNPAGLAGNRKYAMINSVELGAAKEDITAVGDIMGAFNDFNADTVNSFLGRNLYARIQATPALLTPNFGVSIVFDQHLAFLGENRALPHVVLGYQTTTGIQAAYGFSLGRLGKNTGGELRLGIGGKLLWRRGGYKLVPTFDLLNMSQETFKRVVGGFGRGLGVDLAAQYLRQLSQHFSLSSSLVYTDIGDTNFGDGPAPIKGNLAAGAAATYQIRRARISVLYDYRHILAKADWRRKSHLGLEVKMPILSLFAGINQVTPTYGAALDFWLLKITGASVTEELGTFAFQDPQPRWMLRVDLKFEL